MDPAAAAAMAPHGMDGMGGGFGSSANLAELLKTPSLSHLSSFTGGSAAGLSLKGTRTDNASNISLGTFLENNGGDINDILNDFGVGAMRASFVLPPRTLARGPHLRAPQHDEVYTKC